MLLLVLLLTVTSECWGITPLPEIQELFAEQSQTVEPQLQQLRAENTQLRGEQIHWILNELANLTVEMRIITNETWQAIENHELLNDECWEEVKEFFDYYVWYGAQDIGVLATVLIDVLDSDWTWRFNPQMAFMQRENSRTIHQPVKTLSDSVFLEDIDLTLEVLEIYLDFYRSLWASYQVVLRNELGAIDWLEYNVRDEMSWWQDFTIRWHKVFMGYAVDNVRFACT